MNIQGGIDQTDFPRSVFPLRGKMGKNAAHAPDFDRLRLPLTI